MSEVAGDQGRWIAEAEQLLAVVEGPDRWVNLVAEVHLRDGTEADRVRLVEAVLDAWGDAVATIDGDVLTITVPLDPGGVGGRIAEFDQTLAAADVPTRLVWLDVRLAPAYELT